jgi:hypothetical protein
MNGHLSDDDLVLIHYGELTSTHDCADCRARLAELERVLAIAGDEAIPEPPPGYEAQVWRRLEWRLRPSRQRVWIPAVAAAALLVVGFFLGQFTQRAKPPVAGPSTAIETTAPTADDRMAFAAESHLDRSSRLLLEVSNGEPLGRDAATELVASNRLYRVMAERAGAADVAKLLAEIEPILLELENGGDPAAIRKRIEERELIFKLRVIRSLADEKPLPRKGIHV